MATGIQMLSEEQANKRFYLDVAKTLATIGGVFAFFLAMPWVWKAVDKTIDMFVIYSIWVNQ